MKYITQAGDAWDLLSYQFYGSERFTPQLINANLQHVKTFIFKAGVELNVPTINQTTSKVLPPWR